jgi:hypothetical protein
MRKLLGIGLKVGVLYVVASISYQMGVVYGTHHGMDDESGE